MTERLREIVATDDPALAELVRMVRAVSDVDPRPGAQDRVRRALAERPTARRRWQTPLLVAIVLLVVLPVAIAGVQRLMAPPPALPPPVLPREVPAPRSGAPVPPAAAHDVPAIPPPAVPAAPRPPAPLEPPAPEPTGPSAPRRTAAGSEPPAPEPAGPALSPRTAAASDPPVPGATVPPAPPRTSPPASEPRPDLLGPVAPGPLAGAPTHRPAAITSAAPRLRIEPSARPAPPPGTPDAALVVDAMRQLRRGHDPHAALRELDDYLDRFPDGDLAEEVLALALEAHATLGDSAAGPLIEQYLQRYPHGRFREQAERARSRLDERARPRAPHGAAELPSHDR